MIMMVHSHEFNELSRRIDRIAKSQEQIFRLHAEYIRELNKIQHTKVRIARPDRANKAWTAKEKAEVGAAYRKGIPLREIATRQQRTQSAIRSGLIRFGLRGQWRDRNSP
ncbi:MAG: hypothetical protein OXU26_15985 [Acidobacteriota bacterium]|nr:hypothetical protein [Acidobacteriota bacterium]MDE2965409.1 hypothetical protein [Acidobacteriota bacterium]